VEALLKSPPMGSSKKKPSGRDGDPAKRPSGGKNVTPRTPVQYPKDWLAVARRLANAKRQPTIWYLLSLLDADARASGLSDDQLPSLPWVEDEEDE